MSTKSENKVKLILKDLSIELTGSKSIPALAKFLGYTKQALYGWIDKGEIPIQSIKSKVKDINPRYLTGESQVMFESELAEEQGRKYTIEELLKEERSRLDIKGISDKDLDQSLEDLLNDALSLVVKIRRIMTLRRDDDV